MSKAASVQQLLRNQAKAQDINPNILQVRYSLERFLYRLGLSEHKDRITLKGAMLFILWSDKSFRPTKDADFLITGDISPNNIKQVVIDICNIEVANDDAMVYDAESIKIVPIKEDQEYQGLRVTLKSKLGHIPIPVQLDMGTGDVVTPRATEADFKVLIDTLPAPRLKVYNRETVIAEKLQAMVLLDLTNSRMKDFYDVWIICTQFGFDKEILKEAIVSTFKRRGTNFPSEGISSLTEYFYDDPAIKTRWKAFTKKLKLDLSLKQVCIDIKEYLEAVLK
ncbi:nucleotidyl transferase AbiEii/AbiGii toxin family protein [Lentisphaera profundi]|uniref:Nucleotidyl transferase AbiEii/AbiGii toxin family protein n=1 Tax=Lentisphaera profundi TaxID=1658616 RepID=A0ABY7VXM1_9BACT|nr:nucleotidyl transferase AbiEii/AbiGii toxin family protein [Lentisphaera profundi]WDE98940.1 nucleotidyl transferase AbiEii/AbiGii toxin family protein [Lentisphaera profundi]